ncbi:MAG: rhomboid family intramembrane serine protease [Clostridia bacterium]|nr:rhomboid family intramembrane serine protease [Clostridia bacterium]
MVEKYLNAALVHFIDRLGFMPIKDENGNAAISRESMMLLKFISGSHIFVEVLDGDLLSYEDITYRLQNNARFYLENNRSDIQFFAVFVFGSSPDPLKLQAITTGDHLQCISPITVDLTGKDIKKHFRFPFTTHGIEKLLSSLLHEDLDPFSERPDINHLISKKNRENRLEFKVNNPFITKILIAANIIVWVVLLLYSSLYDISANDLLYKFGAKENALILNGEYWRFLTPMFLHSYDMIAHVFFNCYSLYILGTLVERLFGHAKYTFIYFAAGFIGNIASFIFSPHTAVGASGAVYGLMGAIIYFGVENPQVFKIYFSRFIMVNMGIFVVFSFSVSNIDNYAHLGGLLGGFLTAGIVKVKITPNKLFNNFFIIPFTVLLVGLGLFMGFTGEQNKLSHSEYINVLDLEKAYNAGNWDDVQLKGSQLQIGNLTSYNRKKGFFYIIEAEIALNNYEIAESLLKSYKEAYEADIKNKNLIPAYYNQAVIYFKTHKYGFAKEELLKAQEIGKNNPIYGPKIKKLFDDLK